MTDHPGLSPDEHRAAVEFLDRMEIAHRDQDERAASAWVLQVVDPSISRGGYGHQRLVGPFADRSVAEMERERIVTEINPVVAVDGYPPLAVTVVAVHGELR